MPETLDGLDRVDWASLHHAYGPATDVPAQLRALSSADAEVRRQARYALSGNVYHQGSRWQASGHVVPFLAALVEDPATPDRDSVAGLLRAVARDRDAYLAAAAISERIVGWTGDPDPGVAARAAELLAWFPATERRSRPCSRSRRRDRGEPAPLESLPARLRRGGAAPGRPLL